MSAVCQSLVDSNCRGPHVENLNDGHRTGAFGAALLASAAPLNATTIGSAEVSNVDQAGLFCNEYYGRCWRTRGPRYVLRYYYDPSYSPGRGYNYYAGPGYYDRGYGYGEPRFTIRGW